MKAPTDDHRLWVECAVLAGGSVLLAALMNQIFARHKPAEPLTKLQPGDTPSAPWEKPKSEEKAKAEPARRALDQAAAQVDSPEKAGWPNGLKNWLAALLLGKLNRPGSLRSPARLAIK